MAAASPAAPLLSALPLAALNAAMNGFHLVLVFFPIILFYVSPAAARPWLKWVFPLYILVPIHWPLFDNQCIFTVTSIKLGGLEDRGHDSSFSDVYLRWLYEPLIRAAGYCWSAPILDKTIYLHWGVNYLLLCLYTFGYVYTR